MTGASPHLRRMVQVNKTATPKSARGPKKVGRSRAVAVEAAAMSFAYALEGPSAAMLGEGLPAGVRVALVPSSPEATEQLRAWAPVRRVGRLVSEAPSPSRAAIEKADYEPDARSRALLRGVEIARTDLKAAGGAFDLEQVQSLLHGVSRQRVMERVKEGTLLAVPGPSNRRRYPTVQFTREGVVAGLREVQAALPTRNPWAVLNFFVQPDDRLDGQAPIAVLKAGDVDRVVAAARGVGRQGG